MASSSRRCGQEGQSGHGKDELRGAPAAPASCFNPFNTQKVSRDIRSPLCVVASSWNVARGLLQIQEANQKGEVRTRIYSRTSVILIIRKYDIISY